MLSGLRKCGTINSGSDTENTSLQYWGGGRRRRERGREGVIERGRRKREEGRKERRVASNDDQYTIWDLYTLR